MFSRLNASAMNTRLRPAIFKVYDAPALTGVVHGVRVRNPVDVSNPPPRRTLGVLRASVFFCEGGVGRSDYRGIDRTDFGEARGRAGRRLNGGDKSDNGGVRGWEIPCAAVTGTLFARG